MIIILWYKLFQILTNSEVSNCKYKHLKNFSLHLGDNVMHLIQSLIAVNYL